MIFFAVAFPETHFVIRWKTARNEDGITVVSKNAKLVHDNVTFVRVWAIVQLYLKAKNINSLGKKVGSISIDFQAISVTVRFYQQIALLYEKISAHSEGI